MGCATKTKENVQEFHVLDSLSNESTGATSSDRCTPCKQRLTSTAAHAQRTGRSKQTTKRSIRPHNHTFPGYFRTTYSWMRASVCHARRFHASHWRDTSRGGPLPTHAFLRRQGVEAVNTPRGVSAPSSKDSGSRATGAASEWSQYDRNAGGYDDCTNAHITEKKIDE